MGINRHQDRACRGVIRKQETDTARSLDLFGRAAGGLFLDGDGGRVALPFDLVPAQPNPPPNWTSAHWLSGRKTSPCSCDWLCPRERLRSVMTAFQMPD